LTEQFKGQNALLQNSVLYFRLLSTRLSTSEDIGPLTPAVSALAAAILQLRLDNSAAAAHQVANRLNALAVGLATVREIVREHGGAIDVSSVSGVGSRFEVWLPCVSADPPGTPPSPPAAQLGHGETVLVVDDASEPLLADEEMLAALGYEPVGLAPRLPRWQPAKRRRSDLMRC
jgi:hypothetical protein